MVYDWVVCLCVGGCWFFVWVTVVGGCVVCFVGVCLFLVKFFVIRFCWLILIGCCWVVFLFYNRLGQQRLLG